MLRRIREKMKFAGRWVTLPVMDGPLKGMSWIAFAGTNFLKGTYEENKTRAILESVAPGDIAWDIGGHVGYYAIIESRLVGEQGKVLVFEPRPLNIAYIKRHLSINQISNVTLIESAMADQPGKSRFESRTGTGTGHLSDHGNLQVDTVAVDWLVECQGFPAPDFIKLDVEGAEIQALTGGIRTIEKHRPKMLVATHGDEHHRFVLDFLNAFDYHVDVLDNQGKGDIEILAMPSRAA